LRIVNVLYLVIILAISCEINTAQRLWKSGVTPNLERVASIIETKNGDLFATSINGIYQSKDLGNSWFRIYKQGSYIKLKVDKKKINLSEPIKVLGENEIEVKLHQGVNAKLKINIEQED